MDLVFYILLGFSVVLTGILGFVLYRQINSKKVLERERGELLGKITGFQTQIGTLSANLTKSAKDDEYKVNAKLNEIKGQLDRERADRSRVLSDIANRERNLAEKSKTVQDKEKQLNEAISAQQRELEKIAGIAKEEAVKRLTESIQNEVEKEIPKILEKRRVSLEERSEQEARRVISMAIHRYASPHTVENTVSYIDVPSEDFKGKIIGRDGRNIRAIERETGVDVIIDDTPGTVAVSAFDGVRREIARRSLQNLINDGRIHPARIEEVVEKTKVDLEREITKIGEKFLFEQDIHNVHPKLITLLGRLKYRTSYGQNVLQHVSEVGHISSVMAAELGLDQKLARRCGILHDIGKAVDHTFEGSHPELGGILLKRFNEREEVIEAAAHHHTEPGQVKHLYTVLVAAADAISASRPGARGETGEGYVKRVERMEALAKSFPGVINAFCVYAGREMRIIVDSNVINDDKANVLAQDLAKTIEDQLTYPGEIKVTVIREKRIINYAR
ncbi:MAG: ribonuclease Y [Planctomycetes bacterium]|nr:ribonuclease Y [Planctomycetota bacterium]